MKLLLPFFTFVLVIGIRISLKPIEIKFYMRPWTGLLLIIFATSVRAHMKTCVCAVCKQPYLFIDTSTLDPDFTNTKFYSPTAHGSDRLRWTNWKSAPIRIRIRPTTIVNTVMSRPFYPRKQSVFQSGYRTFLQTFIPNLVPLSVYYCVELHASES